MTANHFSHWCVGRPLLSSTGSVYTCPLESEMVIFLLPSSSFLPSTLLLRLIPGFLSPCLWDTGSLCFDASEYSFHTVKISRVSTWKPAESDASWKKAPHLRSSSKLLTFQLQADTSLNISLQNSFMEIKTSQTFIELIRRHDNHSLCCNLLEDRSISFSKWSKCLLNGWTVTEPSNARIIAEMISEKTKVKGKECIEITK